MELIDNALEKARRQRKPSGAARARPVSTDDTDKPKIVYRQTRVEPASPRSLRNNRVLAGFPHDRHADIFRVLRAQVLKYLAESGGSTIGICSPNPGEGKSLIAVNLAVSLSLNPEHTVLLADVDLRRPSIGNYFGLSPGPGLSTYLLRGATIPECLVNPGIERLVLLPAGAAVQTSSEALASTKMSRLAKELKSRYPNRMVIYDLPPLLPSDDALVFLNQVDASILVVEDGKTQEDEIERALDLISEHNLIGTVLNKSEYKSSYYYDY